MKQIRCHSMKALFTIVAFALFLGSSFAQRVLEVEESIKTDVKDYVERILPDAKYTIKVKVTPLRRIEQSRSTTMAALPYMDLDEEHVVDEWDSEDVSLYTLYSRIKEVKVELFIEDEIELDNKEKFIDHLYTEAHLIRGRDNVKLEKFTPISQTRDFNWKQYKDELLIAILLISLCIFGYLMSNIGLALAKKNIGSESSSSAEREGDRPSAASMRSAPQSFSVGSSQSSSSSPAQGGDFFIQDPTKISETVHKKVEQLITSPMFPTMNDMVILENLAQKDMSSFSYLVYELPLEIQEVVYSFGRDQNWFKGFSHVGIPGKDVLITLDLLLRDRSIHFNPHFERTLIGLWRLGDGMKKVLKDIPKDKSLKLLGLLPKQFSIPVARDLFPGSWGQLFDSVGDKEFFNEKEAKTLFEQSIHLKALFNYQALREFKDRKDLLSYLDTVGPKEEREIYSVLGRESDVESIRAPFYRVFDLNEEQRKELKNSFSLENWAMALFNVDHGEREKIVMFFDEKENYLFSDFLKFFGENFSDKYRLEQLAIRKDIAEKIKSYEEDAAISLNMAHDNNERELNEVA